MDLTLIKTFYKAKIKNTPNNHFVYDFSRNSDKNFLNCYILPKEFHFSLESHLTCSPYKTFDPKCSYISRKRKKLKQEMKYHLYSNKKMLLFFSQRFRDKEIWKENINVINK